VGRRSVAQTAFLQKKAVGEGRAERLVADRAGPEPFLARRKGGEKILIITKQTGDRSLSSTERQAPQGEGESPRGRSSTLRGKGILRMFRGVIAEENQETKMRTTYRHNRGKSLQETERSRQFCNRKSKRGRPSGNATREPLKGIDEKTIDGPKSGRVAAIQGRTAGSRKKGRRCPPGERRDLVPKPESCE